MRGRDVNERAAEAMPDATERGNRATGMLWVLAPCWYVLCEAVAALAFPGYDYGRFYISDLGVASVGPFGDRMLDSRLPQVMNAGFVGEGLLFVIGLVLVTPLVRRGPAGIAFLVLGIVHAIGITFVGLVPGSPENAANGLMTIHVLGAFMAIGGGNLAAITSFRALRGALERRVRVAGVVLGVLGLVCAALLTGHVLFPDGVWERGSVYTFMLWQFVVGVALLRARPNPVSSDEAVGWRGLV